MNMGLVREGHIFEDGAEVAALKAENRDLRQQLLDARADATRSRRDLVQAVAALRKQLTPLYRSLQGVFGDMEAFGDAEPMTSAGGPIDGRVAAVWASWKNKLGGTVAKGIDALLLHGELDTAQLAIAAGLDKRTVTNTVVYKLHGAGLINKNNGRFSLKQL